MSSARSLSNVQFYFISKAIKKIRETRDHCRKIMDSYFHNLEDYVRKRMEKMLSDQSDLFRELDKVTTIVSELKMLCNRL